MCFESVDTRIGQRYIAGFPAVRAVIEAVHAKMNLFHALANTAVLLTSAKRFRLLALLANYGATRHECLHKNCT
jgi:hypothetical protein